MTEVKPTYDDSSWKQSKNPLQMGADGDNNAFAWYRTTINISTPGTGTLHLNGRDGLEVFVNGNRTDYHNGSASANLLSGKKTVAVFIWHNGRNKGFDYLGSLSNYDSKGLIGPVTLDFAGNEIPVTGWRMCGGLNDDLANTSKWQEPGISNGMPVFYHATFTTKPTGATGAHPVLRVTFAGLKRGTMWVNGHNLGQYPEKIPVNGLYIPECWLKKGQNDLVVFDAEGATPDQMQLEVEKAASREVISVSAPINPATPIVIPRENPTNDLTDANRKNIVLHASVSASAGTLDGPPDNVTDNDVGTVWTVPRDPDKPWLKVDLGKSIAITSCDIVWEHPSKFYRYNLDGSVDGKTGFLLGTIRR